MTTHTQITEDRILILDFGSQYSQLIARRVREAGVYSEMYAYDMSPEAIQAFKPKGIILSGGPESVHIDGSPRAPQIVFELGVPVLGICYGFQTMSEQLGGKVEAGTVHEFGYAKVDVQNSDRLIGDLSDENHQLDVWQVVLLLRHLMRHVAFMGCSFIQKSHIQQKAQHYYPISCIKFVAVVECGRLSKSLIHV